MPGGPWLFDRIAHGVRLAGTTLDDVLHGPEAVNAQVLAVAGCYEDRTFRRRDEFGDRYVEEYTTLVRGRRMFGTATSHHDDSGETDELGVNHRPLTSALTPAGLVGGEAAPGRALSRLPEPSSNPREDFRDGPPPADRLR
ncbi:hypothetical protein [Amycolatopsis sp. FDAARGOS 1241]|uniref:hypothetical protein n=1 Tax=Amycolatopsis sp. FDAARGOS 1241 TaxID=2778070 RepID=UPI00194E3061|nr:hypothetical protein [Amycolatopsis sp. FDAARGOS 1241]QRP43406.1 hypothetical protein I6J71_28825 [Amycolatopsis sp. FDAARGOS 1241]